MDAAKIGIIPCEQSHLILMARIVRTRDAPHRLTKSFI